jgi:short-subunit dehydrogenase
MVVVSGASRGIGRELVNLLLSSGYEVVTWLPDTSQP